MGGAPSASGIAQTCSKISLLKPPRTRVYGSFFLANFLVSLRNASLDVALTASRRRLINLQKNMPAFRLVSSQIIMGGASHAPVLPLSTKVDTLFMKVSKQTNTKYIGKGLLLSADNGKTQVLRRRKAVT